FPAGPGVGLAGKQVAYVALPDPGPLPPPAELDGQLDAWARSLPAVEAGGRVVSFLWDLLALNGEAITPAFGPLCAEAAGGSPAVTGRSRRLLVHPTARVEPPVVADTRAGPVVIDRGAVVEAFSRLVGPCYVGPGCRVLGARVSGSTLGPG